MYEFTLTYPYTDSVHVTVYHRLGKWYDVYEIILKEGLCELEKMKFIESKKKS